MTSYFSFPGTLLPDADASALEHVFLPHLSRQEFTLTHPDGEFVRFSGVMNTEGFTLTGQVEVDEIEILERGNVYDRQESD